MIVQEDDRFSNIHLLQYTGQLPQIVSKQLQIKMDINVLTFYKPGCVKKHIYPVNDAWKESFAKVYQCISSAEETYRSKMMFPSKQHRFTVYENNVFTSTLSHTHLCIFNGEAQIFLIK